MSDNLEKLRKANERADAALDPWLKRIVESPYTAVIFGVIVLAAIVAGWWLG